MWNLARVTTPDGARTTYLYNEENLLSRIKYADGAVVRYTYDANGNKTYTDAAGVTTTQCDEYNYTDENGNIITDGYGYIDPYTGSDIN